MACLGFELATEGWKVQTISLSYGGPPSFHSLYYSKVK